MRGIISSKKKSKKKSAVTTGTLLDLIGWPQRPLAFRRFLITYQGNCQSGHFGSSIAQARQEWVMSHHRRNLRHLFEQPPAPTDPRLHFRCSGPGSRLKGARNGFDREFYTQSLNTTFALVPHGDNRWSFRSARRLLLARSRS